MIVGSFGTCGKLQKTRLFQGMLTNILSLILAPNNECHQEQGPRANNHELHVPVTYYARQKVNIVGPYHAAGRSS